MNKCGLFRNQRQLENCAGQLKVTTRKDVDRHLPAVPRKPGLYFLLPGHFEIYLYK
jgi:hypothetical protein